MSKLRFILGEQKKSQKALKAFDSKWWKSQDCIGREETVGGETEFWSALSDEMGAFGDVKESNSSSQKIFEKIGFNEVPSPRAHVRRFQLQFTPSVQHG